MVYIENPKESTKQLELISEFSMIKPYKIRKNQLYFIYHYVNDWKMAKSSIYNYIKKCLRFDLRHKIYIRIYKTLLKEIEKKTKWRNTIFN